MKHENRPNLKMKNFIKNDCKKEVEYDLKIEFYFYFIIESNAYIIDKIDIRDNKDYDNS